MDDKIKNLKAKSEKFETRELLGMMGTRFITFGNDAEEITAGTDIFSKTKLMSPQKQYAYLAGLLMSTNYNAVDTMSLYCIIQPIWLNRFLNEKELEEKLNV